MLPIVGQIRARKLRSHIREQREFYERGWVTEEIQDWQLQQFNCLWPKIYKEVPFFQQRVKSGALPRRFQKWQEFTDLIPVMDKKTLQNERALLMSQRKAPDYWQATGGSTAEPVQIPKWESERRIASQDIWYARSWFDIQPSDKLFLLWGHSHLLGRGYQGWINGWARRAKDWLLGYYRYSAYDLSEPALQRAADVLLWFRPAYLLGYAVALDRFARDNEHRRAEFHRLRLKVAVATAECFPTAQSAELIADILGCPVAMEYGAVETGLVAHQRNDRSYSVFWRRYLLEACLSPDVTGAHEIFVTSLYPRCLPLVRYRMGDLICAGSSDGEFHTKFDAVTGRCNDYLIMSNGSMVHSEAFTHVVKDLSSISAYQAMQSADGLIALKYVAAAPLVAHELDEIRRRLNRLHPDLARIRIDRVDSLEQTLAGKTRRVIRASLPES